jgi:hypothetical protein
MISKYRTSFVASACFQYGRSMKMFRCTMLIAVRHAGIHLETSEGNSLPLRESVHYCSQGICWLAIPTARIGTGCTSLEFQVCCNSSDACSLDSLKAG